MGILSVSNLDQAVEMRVPPPLLAPAPIDSGIILSLLGGNMRSTVVLLALAGALAGCYSPEKEMLDSVRAELKDPSSAEFTKLDMKKTTDGTIYVLCGMVNAKNLFGGYAGAQPFTVLKSKREDGAITHIGAEADCSKSREIAETVAKGRDKR